MRRRPDKNNHKQQNGIQRYVACHSCPADHRWESPCCAANDDILRCAAFQPHRINDEIKKDRERQYRGGHHIGGNIQHPNGRQTYKCSKAKRGPWGHLSLRNRTFLCAGHLRVNIRVIPHIKRARGACPCRDTYN